MAEEKLCPFCDGPLEQGLLVGSGLRLRWFTGKVSFFDKIFILSGDTVKSHGWTPPEVKGFRCKKCRKMILDY